MKKVMNLVIGGIQQKVFNLVLITVLLLVGAYTGMLAFQYGSLKKLAAESNSRQEEAIRQVLSETMDGVIALSSVKETGMGAALVDDLFKEARESVEIMGDYAQKLFDNPDEFPPVAIQTADPENAEDYQVQVLAKAGMDPDDPAYAEKIGLLANMQDLMKSLFHRMKVNSCFIGTPEGLLLICGENAGGKFDEEGNPLHIDVCRRSWYTGAEETGEVFFTNVEQDSFTGVTEISCSLPVYSDGELEAVIGVDLFLDFMEDEIAAAATENTFSCIINRDGHVIFSPREEGIFAPTLEKDAKDLRECGEEELASYLKDALAGDTNVRLVNVEGKEWYMTAAPLSEVDWYVVFLVDKEAADVPMITLQEEQKSISAGSAEEFREGLKKFRKWMIILVLLILVVSISVANALAKKIVHPLNTMSQRIQSLDASNQLFQMEDVYRTDDEIQVLAEAFARISKKTVQYVQEVRRVTAEKERMGVELGMAKAIQESQLPSIFPAFPDRPDFDIYATMTPAKEVGGDFYDFFLSDPDHLCMVMADVSGKGVPAALFMMISKILLKNRMQDGENLVDAVSNVNNQLTEGNQADMFVTVWVCMLDLRTGEGTALNAGHEHPALRRAGGKYELVTYKHSIALGAFEDTPYHEHKFKLNPGDSVFAYTDGVPEANNKENDFYGTERMLDTLNRNLDVSPAALVKAVAEDIEKFADGADQFDDITMLAFTYKGPEGHC